MLASKRELHGDKGATLKAATVLTVLYLLRGKPSYSSPRMSDDNAYAESLFRAAKYCREIPAKSVVNVDGASGRAAESVSWYTNEHSI